MNNAFGAAQQPNQYPPMDPGDEKLFVKFYMGALKDEEKSEAEGRPVFNSVPFVQILVPGDKNTAIDTLVNATHKRRFARAWDQFQQNQSQELSGLPIREWSAITRAQAEELAYMNVMTVEQLATLPDVYGTKIMGFNDLKRKAETFLQQAKDSALSQKMAAENEKLHAEIDRLNGEVKRLSDMFEVLRSGQKDANDNGSRTRANRSG
jgi:dynactin complex subunit